MLVGGTEYTHDDILDDWYVTGDSERELDIGHVECLDEIYRLRNLHGGLVQCIGCEGWFPISKLNPSSPHPEASPVCDRCLELESVTSMPPTTANLRTGYRVGVKLVKDNQ